MCHGRQRLENVFRKRGQIVGSDAPKFDTIGRIQGERLRKPRSHMIRSEINGELSGAEMAMVDSEDYRSLTGRTSINPQVTCVTHRAKQVGFIHKTTK